MSSSSSAAVAIVMLFSTAPAACGQTRADSVAAIAAAIAQAVATEHGMLVIVGEMPSTISDALAAVRPFGVADWQPPCPWSKEPDVAKGYEIFVDTTPPVTIDMAADTASTPMMRTFPGFEIRADTASVAVGLRCGAERRDGRVSRFGFLSSMVYEVVRDGNRWNVTRVLSHFIT